MVLQKIGHLEISVGQFIMFNMRLSAVLGLRRPPPARFCKGVVTNTKPNKGELFGFAVLSFLFVVGVHSFIQKIRG